jgi:trehalose/maltose hydrolase-like predicted phosphorylase
MAGTVDLVQRVSTGIEISGELLKFSPQLPEGLDRLDMRIRYRGHTLDLKLTRATLTVRGHETAAAPIQLQVRDETCACESGDTQVFRLTRSSTAAGVR